jgi:4-amino-4-deoxy-L-arabinose transferase-like glycosyltransferase
VPELDQDLTGPGPLRFAAGLPRPVRSLFPDLLLVAGLLAVAAVVRLPYLQLVPVISDEAFEVLAAQGMVGGKFIWFGPFDPTTGPLVTWLLALAVWLFGSSAYLARTVTLLFGVLTVGLTYLLGRSLASYLTTKGIASRSEAERTKATKVLVSPGQGPVLTPVGTTDRSVVWRGRVAGLAAGLLLAFNPVHTIVNSHVAWSNSATPFLAAATFLALHAAMRRGDGRLLVLGGLLYGLALQTHISMLVVIPGLLVWFLARRDLLAWLRRPWPYLAVLAAALGYSNMIVYNVMSQGGLLADAQLHTYAWEPSPNLLSYLNRLAALLTNLGQTVGGQVPRVADPLAGLVVGLLVAWRGEALPLLVLLSTALAMPYFNKRYDGLLSQRYTAFLLPLCLAAMGVLAGEAVGLWRKAGRSAERVATGAGQVGREARTRQLVAGLVAGLMLIVAIYPVRNTLAYYSAETQAGRDNRLTLAFTGYVKTSLPPGTALYVSSGLRDKADGPGYRFLRAIYYYLTMEGVQHRVLDLPDIAAALEAAPDQAAWLVLTADDYLALEQRFGLEPIVGGPAVPNGGYVAGYRLP